MSGEDAKRRLDDRVAKHEDAMKSLFARYKLELRHVDRLAKREDDQYFLRTGRHTEQFQPTTQPKFNLQRVLRPLPERKPKEEEVPPTKRISPAATESMIERLSTVRKLPAAQTKPAADTSHRPLTAGDVRALSERLSVDEVRQREQRLEALRKKYQPVLGPTSEPAKH